MGWGIWALLAVTETALCSATSVLIEFLVLLAHGALAGRLTDLARRPRFARLANRIAGSMLIGAGIGLVRLRRA